MASCLWVPPCLWVRHTAINSRGDAMCYGIAESLVGSVALLNPVFSPTKENRDSVRRMGVLVSW
jgi:hypothetical protein